MGFAFAGGAGLGGAALRLMEMRPEGAGEFGSEPVETVETVGENGILVVGLGGAGPVRRGQPRGGPHPAR